MSEHTIERTWLAARAATWAAVFGGEPWYRCVVCGMISTRNPTGECEGEDRGRLAEHEET